MPQVDYVVDKCSLFMSFRLKHFYELTQMQPQAHYQIQDSATKRRYSSDKSAVANSKLIQKQSERLRKFRITIA